MRWRALRVWSHNLSQATSGNKPNTLGLVSSEQLFSVFGRIVTLTRLSLLPMHMGQLTLLHDNIEWLQVRYNVYFSCEYLLYSQTAFLSLVGANFLWKPRVVFIFEKCSSHTWQWLFKFAWNSDFDICTPPYWFPNFETCFWNRAAICTALFRLVSVTAYFPPYIVIL